MRISWRNRVGSLLTAAGMVFTSVLVLSACAQQSGTAPAQTAAPTVASPAAQTAASPAPQSAAPSASRKPDLGKLKIVTSGLSISHAYYLIAKAEGLFEKEGFSGVEIIDAGGGPESAAVLTRGDADVSATADPLWRLVEKGEDFKGIAALYKGHPTFLVMRESVAKERGITPTSPRVDRVKALKGLKIGMSTPGSPTDLLARFMLKSAGYDPDKDASIVPLTSASAMLAALQQGQIDAMMNAHPFAAQAEKQDFGVTILGAREFPEFENYVLTAFVARGSDLRAKPARYEAIARGVVTTGRFIKSSTPEQLQALIQSSFSNIDPAIMTASVKDEAGPGRPIHKAATDPVIHPAELQTVLDFMGIRGVDPTKAIDDSFIRKALSQ